MQIHTRILVGVFYCAGNEKNIYIFFFRHSWGDAERQRSNGLVSKSYPRQQALIQGKDSPRRRMWNRNPQHVRCESRRRTCRWSELVHLCFFKFDWNFFPKIDMSNIIDQAQNIIEANGFKDS